jgi:hypothetical protein
LVGAHLALAQVKLDVWAENQPAALMVVPGREPGEDFFGIVFFSG